MRRGVVAKPPPPRPFRPPLLPPLSPLLVPPWEHLHVLTLPLYRATGAPELHGHKWAGAPA